MKLEQVKNDIAILNGYLDTITGNHWNTAMIFAKKKQKIVLWESLFEVIEEYLKH